MLASAARLDQGWSLEQARRGTDAPAVPTIPATVPGCVHTDLLAAGLIPDPFVGTNEADLAWIAGCDWRYSCDVDVATDQLAHAHLDLTFAGLDTLASISWNGELVADTANMHRRYRFDVGPLARAGRNRLEIVFSSATRYCERTRDAEGDWPSSSFGRPFNYLRKMACSWGWDWGPWLTTAGVWRPAALEAWTYGRLGDIRPHVTVDDDNEGRIDVEIDAEIDAQIDGPLDPRLRITLFDPNGDALTSTTTAVAPTAGTHVASRISIDVGTIERWWPYSHGGQPLYTMRVELIDRRGTVHAERELRVGFRTIELDTAADATGSAFTFVVNGRPIFVRGANWIPDDVFVSRVGPDRYRARIADAIDAHVDLLRVWGGGIYEDDEFYAACDELGVLVWQDFAFACAAYPEQLLAAEVEAEARDNVARLMHHPSLALWNGNNENLWGYHDWGWQETLGDRPWGAGFYLDLLPRVCATLDPLRPYWAGSPWSGSDHVHPNADAHGCVHVWDVWNDVDLDRYRDRTPRFVAEFGWQAPPSVRTLEEYLGQDALNRSTPAWASHQKATDGDLKLDRGIAARFGPITDFEAFCYAAHVVQARAIRTGIEHFRSLRPYCMGTVWWQLNDCWPVTSWAVVDSRARRKPGWYALRDAYRPRLLTVQPRGGALVVVAVNETASPWHVRTDVVRGSITGEELAGEPIELSVEPFSAAHHAIGSRVADPVDPRSEFLTVGEPDDRAWWWYAPDRAAPPPPAHLDVRARTDGNEGIVLTVTADTVVRALTIYPERVRPTASIDRQLIDLLPDEPTEFRVKGVVLDDVAALTRAPALWHVGWLLRTGDA